MTTQIPNSMLIYKVVTTKKHKILIVLDLDRLIINKWTSFECLMHFYNNYC